MAKLFANSGDSDQTPRSAASDLGLHCLPNILLRVSRLQWVKLDLLEIVLIISQIPTEKKITHCQNSFAELTFFITISLPMCISVVTLAVKS